MDCISLYSCDGYGTILVNRLNPSFNTSDTYNLDISGGVYGNSLQNIGFNMNSANNAFPTNSAATLMVDDGGIYNGGGFNCQGNIAVGNTTPSTSTTSGALIVYGGIGCGGNIYSGNIYAGNLISTGSITASSFNATSDYRLKTNVMPLNGNFIVDKLRPVSYNLKINNKIDVGFLAHEVQEHFPFLVTGEKDGENTQSINYNGFIGILVKEIQDSKKEIQDLKKELIELNLRLTNIESQI